jgi:serine/threonine-protein kinase RsbW
MTHTAQVRLEVESRPENLALVRRVLVAFADALAVDGPLVGDIETAVSEACNNVVLHAYGDQLGPLIVSLAAGETTIEACVEDRGHGIQGRSKAGPSTGIGLPLIGALADRAEFRSLEGGTRVRMGFGARRKPQVRRRPTAPLEPPRPADAPPAPSA